MILREYIDEKNAHPNMSKDLILFREELARKFPELRYTSGYRAGATTASGNQSRHGKGEAWDIEDRQDVYDYLWNTTEGIQLLKKYNLGILDETNPDTMKRTGATGKHYHIGKDSTLVPLMEQRYNELMGNKSQVASTQTYGQSARPTLTEEELLNMAYALRSGNTGAAQSISVSPSDMDVLNYFRIEKAKEQEAQSSQAVETKKEELMTHASTQQQEAELQDDSAYYESLMNFPDPYNYINIETYQRGGRKRPVVKDERMKAAQVKSTIPTFRERLPEVQESDYAGLIDPINLDEVVIKVSKEQMRREDYLEEAKNIETEYVDPRLTQGIKTPKTREEVMEAQKFLSEQGYDLDPDQKFKNKGIDGILGKVTKNALTEYNKKIKGDSPYTPVKEGTGKLGECTETQCSEYVQNEIYRNISPDIDRKEWNEKLGITGNAWEIGNNIVRRGGKEVSPQLVREGDVVTIYTGGFSEYQNEADKAGERTTHTGVVDKVNEDGTYTILHNVHRKDLDGNFKGREFRNVVSPDGKVEGWSYFTVQKAFRPNYDQEGLSKSKVDINKKLKVQRQENSYTKSEADEFIEPINNPKNKEKFINYYDLDEEEYYSIGKAAVGIMGQETNFGTNLAYKSGVKSFAATLANMVGMKEDEPSRGAGSMKLDTNITGQERSLFGIKKSNLSQPDKAMFATMQKLTHDYRKYLKQGYNKKDALYRAIARYNGFSPNTISGDKTKEEWAKEYDLDYANKVISFASDFKVSDGEGNFKTIIDEISVNDNVVKWQDYVKSQSQ